jgi:hypothetical protein
MSTSCPPNEGDARKGLRRHVGERFHADAYGFWAAGDVFEEVARKWGGVSERQVRRWAEAERWKERLQATQRKALAKLEEKDANRLVRLAQIHQRGARKLRRYALGLLKTGALEVDPTSGQAQKLMKRDPATGESVRAWALMLGAHFVWRPVGDLYESVRTGSPGFRRLYGERFFEWAKTHPEDGAIFNAAMTSGSARRFPALLAAYDFTQFERIVDVGGGHGALLAGILCACPKMLGVLFDLLNVVAGAERLRIAGFAERCEIVGGDFFESVPAGGDAYILSRVIHDLDDAAGLKILANCRRAIQPAGRLLLIEGLSKPPNEPDPNKFLDVWFVGGGGCERTDIEYRALLRSGGFELVRVVATGGPGAILESRPV